MFTGIRQCSPVLSSEVSSKPTHDLYLERVSHPVHRRIPTSTFVSQEMNLSRLQSVFVQCRLPALLSGLLSCSGAPHIAHYESTRPLCTGGRWLLWCRS